MVGIMRVNETVLEPHSYHACEVQIYIQGVTKWMISKSTEVSHHEVSKYMTNNLIL